MRILPVAALIALVLSGGGAPFGATASGQGVAAASYARDMPRDEAGDLTLLSYNVEGLPWPVARGRSTAARAIAAQLHALRAQGEAPQVVAIQEGFRAADKRIGAEAGYRYASLGPSEADSGAPPSSVDERRFAAGAHYLKGEDVGRYVDSGLAIFSDYPILWARREAFPGYACAGFDCLANKGVLAVALAVPGAARPIVVIDTHLNSGTASGTPQSRSFYAFERQVDALRGFVDSVAPAGTPAILAGDFNIGTDRRRQPYFGASLLADPGLRIAAAEHSFGPGRRMAVGEQASEAAAVANAKTMLIVRDATPSAHAVGIFGRSNGGAMLSDHIGIAMRFEPAGAPSI